MRSDYAMARYANIVLGAWIFVSPFLWPHGYAQRTNAWVVGSLSVALAVAALRAPIARYLLAVLAVWLFLSAFALPTLRMATVWNGALVAIAMFFVALLPEQGTPRGPRAVGPGSIP
jgi:hypothetical protein